MDISKIIEVERRTVAEKTQLKYVTYLYNKAEVAVDPPSWDNCFNISIDGNISECIDIILNTAAGKLVHSNKIATEIVKMTNAIFVKTEEANV